jgi:hypothetical protein
MNAATATFLIALGLAIAIHGAARGVSRARRIARDPGRALAIMRGFRRAVVGLALAGIGAALLWQIPGLLTLSLLIAGEELLESTVMIVALAKDELAQAETQRAQSARL